MADTTVGVFHVSFDRIPEEINRGLQCRGLTANDVISIVAAPLDPTCRPSGTPYYMVFYREALPARGRESNQCGVFGEVIKQRP